MACKAWRGRDEGHGGWLIMASCSKKQRNCLAGQWPWLDSKAILQDTLRGRQRSGSPVQGLVPVLAFFQRTPGTHANHVSSPPPAAPTSVPLGTALTHLL
jgi:hypothetical protein